MSDKTNTPITDKDGRVVCGVESDSMYSFMAGGRFCSLDPDHVNDPDSPHVAYEGHKVTGHGRNVIWLGPWVDDRPYKGEQADRFEAEWANRYDDPIWRAEQDAFWEGVAARADADEAARAATT